MYDLHILVDGIWEFAGTYGSPDEAFDQVEDNQEYMIGPCELDSPDWEYTLMKMEVMADENL